MGTALRVLVGDLRSGAITDELPGASAEFADTLNNTGSARITVPLDAVPSGVDLRAITAPWRTYAALVRGGSVVFAGPILPRRRTPGSAMVEIHAAGLWAVFDHRVLANVGGWDYTDARADIHLVNLTLGSIAAGIVAASMNRPAGELPIILPASVAGDRERHYYGYELATAGTRLRQLSAVEGGPDIHFAPRFRADASGIEWVLRIGAPHLGQWGSEHYFDHGAGLLAWGSDEDPSVQASTVIVPGDGIDRTRLVGAATDTTLPTGGWPALDHVITAHSSVKELATVQAHARAYLAAYKTGITTDTALVRTDIDPQLGVYQVGDDAAFTPHPDPFTPAGTVRRRILTITTRAGNPTTAELTLAPVPSLV